MILEAMIQRKHPGWASFASVCREWQLFIEKRNFGQLKLQVSCLDDFQRLVVRQRELVQHIWLDIELPRYSCRCCKREESFSGMQRNSSVISSGIWKLFCVLGKWKTTNGLTLEVNAHSPSDSEHWFKHHSFFPDGDAVPVQETDCTWHDPQHGWVHGQQVKSPPEEAVLRLFSTTYLSFKQGLPQVDVVTCFIIRRQLRRRLSQESLGFILEKLPRLGNACAFICHVGREGARITWRSTWEMGLSPRVVKAWERVALESHSYALEVDK